MFPKKSAKPLKRAFTNEQIRARAYQIWEKNKEQSEEENWNAAIKALERERRFRVLISIWRWTGLREKKGWDIFIQLLSTVSIPLLLFLGTQYFTNQNNERQQEIAEQNKIEQENIVEEKQKDELLKTYLNNMKEFLLDKELPLKKSTENDEIRSFTRTITLVTLKQLNSSKYEKDRQRKNERKSSIIEFLFESGLIKFDPNVASIIPLNKSDFRFVSLYNVNLYGANLERIDFYDADLQATNLGGANLYEANFYEADLYEANLRSANLEKANLYKAQNLTNQQIKTSCNWKKAIYTANDLIPSNDSYERTPVDKIANQQRIDEIKQDKASDPKTPPDCSRWR